jgi:chemotaxis protein CheZ
MTNPAPVQMSPAEEALLRIVSDALTSLRADMTEMRQYVNRRIQEMSAEFASAVELMELGEKSIIKGIMEVRTDLAAIVHSAGGSSSANTGLELEVVLDLCEQSATRILDAAERIVTITNRKVSENANPQDIRDALAPEIEQIFEACSFQDLTGQRVRRAISNLSAVERKLEETIGSLWSAQTEQVEPHSPAGEMANLNRASMKQSDIDRLMGAGALSS